MNRGVAPGFAGRGFAANRGFNGRWHGRHNRYGWGYGGLGLGLAVGGLGYGYGYDGYGYDDGYYGGYAPAAYGYDQEGYDVAQPQAVQPARTVGYCVSRFKSYDRRSGTYLGNDGARHACP
ncbi:hypothetical protein GCM10007884_36290 [Methylobacterium brachythecii]|uniref:Lectin-like protein BA14k n=1 Tax=Methylobacterium brachythecii TaxID=1176177 RepID=A0ABQ6DBE8_9HYPH|nr:hypothetical protein GCM10007884_36290 [Methylobacterium brachythecii]